MIDPLDLMMRVKYQLPPWTKTLEDAALLELQAVFTAAVLARERNDGPYSNVWPEVERLCGPMPDKDDDVAMLEWVREFGRHIDAIRAIHDCAVELYDAANARAYRLMLDLVGRLLGREERRRFTRWRHMNVPGSLGGMYRIWETGKVERIEFRTVRWRGVASYCIHEPDRKLPRPDEIIASVLQLVTDEGGFLATANATDEVEARREHYRVMTRRRREIEAEDRTWARADFAEEVVA